MNFDEFLQWSAEIVANPSNDEAKLFVSDANIAIEAYVRSASKVQRVLNAINMDIQQLVILRDQIQKLKETYETKRAEIK